MIKILIAEDEEPIANLIRMNLLKVGYKCTWASDGVKAADLMMEENWLFVKSWGGILVNPALLLCFRGF